MKNVFYIIAIVAVVFAFSNANAGNYHKKNWLEKEMSDIHKDYDEALKKIDKSHFSDEQKTVLKAQAKANQDLAEAQAQAVDAQLQKNMQERKDMLKDTKEDKHKAHKIFKEIDDIL